MFDRFFLYIFFYIVMQKDQDIVRKILSIFHEINRSHLIETSV